MSDYKTIAESKNFIVLDKYTKEWQANESYQSEGDLEREFIQDLVHQGYDAPSDLNTPAALLANVRAQLQALNKERLRLPMELHALQVEAYTQVHRLELAIKLIVTYTIPLALCLAAWVVFLDQRRRRTAFH